MRGRNALAVATATSRRLDRLGHRTPRPGSARPAGDEAAIRARPRPSIRHDRHRHALARALGHAPGVLEMEDGKPGPTADGAAGAAGPTSALLTLAMLPAGPAFCAAAADGAPGRSRGARSGFDRALRRRNRHGQGLQRGRGRDAAQALVFGIGLFFLVPLAAGPGHRGPSRSRASASSSPRALIRVVMFIGYLLIIGTGRRHTPHLPVPRRRAHVDPHPGSRRSRSRWRPRASTPRLTRAAAPSSWWWS